MFSDFVKYKEDIVLNNLCYCHKHARDVCHECGRDYAYLNEERGFKLPDNSKPQFPDMLKLKRINFIRECMGRRWLDMQMALYPYQPPKLTASLIKFPEIENSDDGSSSGLTLQKKLLQVFHKLQELTTTQRYYYGNQSRIMLEDYETFREATVLYEEELDYVMQRMVQWSLDLGTSLPGHKEAEARSKSSILNKVAFFLMLNTYRTFWRTMELTAEAFVMHTERYEEEADGHVVFTDKARIYLIQWVAHFFWALRHAQFRLNRLRTVQHEVYQRDPFPFYPVALLPMNADRDVHVIIAKLSKAPIYDFPSFSSLFQELREAVLYPAQMNHINAEVMATIDELSVRFRVMELLLSAVQLVASENDIKEAMMTYKFRDEGREINSKMDHARKLMTKVDENEYRQLLPKNLSYLQKLIVKENQFRNTHVVRFLRPPFVGVSTKFTKEMFDEFKALYSYLYRDRIRKMWKELENSLLPLEVARRHQHRSVVQKKKKKKNKSTSDPKQYEQADMREARYVPESAFFGREKYVPPVVREKVKTRKPAGTNVGECSEPTEDDTAVVSEEIVTNQVLDAPLQRALDQLKKSDVTTRDLLWHKSKGTLRWSDLTQFLTRLGCHLLPQDGSKVKIIDPLTGRWTVLHRPHPGDVCRPDQRESYRIHIEDWLKIKFSDFEALDDMWETV